MNVFIFVLPVENSKCLCLTSVENKNISSFLVLEEEEVLCDVRGESAIRQNDFVPSVTTISAQR